MGFPVFYLGLRRLTRIISAPIVLALALTALHGCTTTTAVKVAYNQSPDLAYWWLDDYADFNGVQSLQLKAALARLQDWHRQTQLPLYAQSLQGLQRLAPTDISADQACRMAADARAHVATVLEQIEPTAASLAATLQPAQLDTMARKFAKGNAEWRGDFIEVSAQKMQTRRFKQARERAELLYGSLNDTQSAALKRGVAQSVFDPALAYTERLRRQQDMLQTLRAITAAAAPTADASRGARASVHALLGRALTSPDAAYRRYQEALTSEGCALFADLHQRASTTQRLHAAQALKRYEDLLLSLAGQAG